MLRVVSIVNKDCEASLEIYRSKSPLERELKPDEVVIRVEAAPINPSDLGMMLPPGTDDDALKTVSGTENGLKWQINKKFAPMLKPRVGPKIPCGNEGAGVVVKAGSSKEAQAMLNKVVAVSGGMYSQFKKAKVSQLITLPSGVTPQEAASSYVNPVTCVAMVDTVLSKGERSFIHTAAASQLGIMLVKYCQTVNVDMINIVRKEAQEKLLRNLGAKYVIRSDKKTFLKDLTKAIVETKCRIAFDAIGGGSTSSQLLTAMENGARSFAKFDPSSPYGTDVDKIVFIYGGLDRSPTKLSRGFGFSWTVTSWLMPRYLESVGKAKVAEMYKTVGENIKTIFKTEYAKAVSLREMVHPDNFKEYSKQATGKKYLVLPQKDIQASKL